MNLMLKSLNLRKTYEYFKTAKQKRIIRLKKVKSQKLRTTISFTWQCCEGKAHPSSIKTQTALNVETLAMMKVNAKPQMHAATDVDILNAW